MREVVKYNFVYGRKANLPKMQTLIYGVDFNGLEKNSTMTERIAIRKRDVSCKVEIGA